MGELYTPEVCYDLSMRTPRFLSAAVLAVLLSALVGGFVGSSAQATQDQVSVQYRVFTAALAAVERDYAEPLPSDRLIYDAIGGMLQTLDPHSSFFDPKTYAQMQERQEGKYYGIGLSILTIARQRLITGQELRDSLPISAITALGSVVPHRNASVTSIQTSGSLAWGRYLSSPGYGRGP